MDTTREILQVHYAISRRLSADRQLELAMGMVDAGRAIEIAELRRLMAKEWLGEELYLRVYEPAVKKNISG